MTLALGREIATQRDRLAAQAAERTAQLGAMRRHHRILEAVDLVDQIVDHGSHALDQPGAQHDQELPGAGRAAPAGKSLAQVTDRDQPAMAHRQDARRLQPDPDPDHVFGIGAWVEIDAAQHAQQRVLEAQLAWAHVLGQQRAGDHRVEPAVPLQPAPGIGAGAIQMHPEQAVLRSPARDFGPADRAAAAATVEQVSTDQAVVLGHATLSNDCRPAPQRFKDVALLTLGMVAVGRNYWA